MGLDHVRLADSKLSMLIDNFVTHGHDNLVTPDMIFTAQQVHHYVGQS